MANTEQIEARLCAYVDGELDAAERAEIEQHLAANPQHRQLLDELMAQRQLLRQLPRDKAPADLFDSFQTQLERSVLLGGGPAPHVAGRINPWPQVFAVAAVLMLAVGLFAVIYFVLPDQNTALRDYAIVTTQPLPDATPAPDLKKESAAVLRQDALSPHVADRAGGKEDAGTTTPTAMAKGSGAFTDPGGNFYTKADAARGSETLARKAEDPFADIVLDHAIVQRVKDSPQVPQSSMLVVWACPDPKAADKQVAQYLTDNGFLWEALPEPMPVAAPARRNEIYASKLQSKSFELRTAERAVNAPADAQGQQVAPEQEIAQLPAAPEEQKQEQKAKPEQVQREAVTRAPAASAAPAPPVPPGAQVALPPVSQAAPAPSADLADVPASVEPPLPSAPAAPAVAAQLEPTSKPARDDFDARCIVVRNVTKSQVAQINTLFIAQNTGRIANYQRVGDTITPTQPALAAQSLTQVQQQTIVPSTSLAGAIQQLGQLKELDLATSAPAPTTQATTQPLTPLPVPADIAPRGLTAATTQPATQALIGGGIFAATAPTTASEGLAALEEERVDVVIVMKPESPAPTAKQPAATTTAPIE